MEKNSKEITIHLWTKDSYIFEFPSFIANVIDQAHKHDQMPKEVDTLYLSGTIIPMSSQI